MTARDARIYFSEFDDLLLTDATFADAALGVLKHERPFDTFTPATAGNGLIDHWIEHGYLKSYKAGREFNPFTEDIRVLPDENGDYTLAMSLVEHDLYIDKADLLGVLAEWNMPLPEGLGAVPDATLLKHRSKLGRKPGTHKQNLAKILDALEEWATAEGRTFDRGNMPGPLGNADEEGSFHWLCARLYPSNFQKTERAFEEHRAGVCAFAAWAKPSDIYLRALPHIAQKLGVPLKPKTGRKPA